MLTDKELDEQIMEAINKALKPTLHPINHEFIIIIKIADEITKLYEKT